MALFSKDPAPPAPVSMRRDTPAPMTGTTIIGANITVEGTLSGSEPVVVEGTIRGHVKLSADLRIGAKGCVEATIHARAIIIEGRVEGDVSADERVELLAGSGVEGNIKAPKIVMADGAKFRGNVDMGSARPRDGAEAKAR